jgi:hypothetical protein
MAAKLGRQQISMLHGLSGSDGWPSGGWTIQGFGNKYTISILDSLVARGLVDKTISPSYPNGDYTINLAGRLIDHAAHYDALRKRAETDESFAKFVASERADLELILKNYGTASQSSQEASTDTKTALDLSHPVETNEGAVERGPIS